MAAVPVPLSDLLIAVPVVILVSRTAAQLLRRVGQPPVVGEILAGILLGPSLLGALWPDGQAWLFDPSVIPYIDMLGNVGLLVFMFLVGLELDLGALRGDRRTALAVSQAGTAVPLVLGVLLALGMYGPLAPEGTDRLPFVLFIGVALSITAFPVLARILTDRGLYRTRVGALAMASAAVGDVSAWCLLAAVVAIANSGSPFDAVTTALYATAFAFFLFYVVRPLLTRWTARAERGHSDAVVLVVLFSGLCLSGYVTDLIGVHALFGAFLFGAITPRGSRRTATAASRLRAFAVPVLLPLFFVSTGLRTDVSLLGGGTALWWWAGAVLAVAGLGKWGGSALAARLTGNGWRDAMSLGALMNCRGLTELVVLDIGLGLGIVGPDLFTVLVLMALVTTAVTAPALSLIRRKADVPAPDDPAAPESAEAENPALQPAEQR
ncbi:cation:proton antiporter [Streptomyces sp. NPDC048224]|uniref:cation:proton antiporter domain-containing protein n=1 Tax=Streptomyces sp. NPDC048224 TaxID=3154500 RepID=UPI0033EEBF57